MGDTLEEYLAAVDKNKPPEPTAEPPKPYLSDKWQAMWNQDTQGSKIPAISRLLGVPLSRYGGALEAMGNEVSKPLSPAWTTPIGDVAKRGPVGVASTGLEMLGDTLGRLINVPLAGGRELLGKGISNTLADAYNYSSAALRQDEANMQAKLNSVRGMPPKHYSANPSYQEIYPESKPNENFMDFLKYLVFTVKNDPSTWMLAGAGPAKSLAGEALSGARNFARTKQAADVLRATQIPESEMGKVQEMVDAAKQIERQKNIETAPAWAKSNHPVPSAFRTATEQRPIDPHFDRAVTGAFDEPGRASMEWAQEANPNWTTQQPMNWDISPEFTQELLNQTPTAAGKYLQPSSLQGGYRAGSQMYGYQYPPEVMNILRAVIGAGK